jgi:glycosyltransferase involved in cell wall biosynthesis
MGSGAATRTGLEFAKRNNYKYAVTIDADGQHSPKDLIKIINKLSSSKSDLVIGSRMIKPGKMPVHRKFGNNLLSAITTIFMGVRVADSQSGLKGFSRDAIEKIDIKTNGFEFCSEILWKANNAKLDIVEIPIKTIYTRYSLSKGQSSINALRIIKSIIIQKLRDV